MTKPFNLKSWCKSFPQADTFKEQWVAKHNYVMVEHVVYKTLTHALALFQKSRVHITVDQIAEATGATPHMVHAALDQRLISTQTRLAGFAEALATARDQWKKRFDYQVWVYYCGVLPYPQEAWTAALDTYSEWTGTDTANNYFVEERLKFAEQLAKFALSIKGKSTNVLLPSQTE